MLTRKAMRELIEPVQKLRKRHDDDLDLMWVVWQNLEIPLEQRKEQYLDALSAWRREYLDLLDEIERRVRDA